MASPNSLVGAVLCGRYRLTKLIGQGGMGSVYEAQDRQMSDRVVAVKVLASHLAGDETQVIRFEQEARAANQLRHPNTISILDFGRSDDGLLFMALEYLHGETLTQTLRHGPIDPVRGLYMLRQVCKSLAEAHAKGIIHRDLKPDNIFVCEIYGESDFIKVIDFGIAKLAVGGAELTQAGKMFGTPRYLSPEQAQGLPLTAPSDLYSLGVILFEMLTGHAPFHADDSLSIAMKHVQDTPPTLREAAPHIVLPAELERLVARLLAKTPAQRFQTAEEVLAAVDECLHTLNPTARVTGPLTPTGPRTPSKPKTIPPVLAPRLAAGPVKPLAEDEATRTLTVNQESTEILSIAPDEEPAAPQPTPAENRPTGDGHTLALAVEETPSGHVVPRRAERPAPPARRPAAAASGAKAPGPGDDAHNEPNKLVLLAITVVLAAVGGGAAWLWRGEAGKRAAEAQRAAAEPVPAALPPDATRAPARATAIIATPTPPPAAVAPAAVAAPTYDLEIVSDPPGAAVTIDAMPAGTTPVQLKLGASAKPIIAVLSLAGHQDYRLEIDPQRVREAGITRMPIHLAERPQPKPAAPKPAPRKPKVEW